MLLIDETFWVAASIILILMVIFKYGKAPLTKLLNNRSASISNKIAEAMSLLGEAEKLLKEQKKLHKKYIAEMNEANKYVSVEIALLKQQAELDFVTKLNNKTAAIESKIIHQQNSLLSKLRLESVELAIKTITAILQKQETHLMNDKILNDSINAIMTK